MVWYYLAGSERTGPVDDAELESLIADGSITDDTLVWNESMPDWGPLSSARAAAAETPEPVAASPEATDTSPSESLAPDAVETEPQATCCSCNTAHSISDMIQYEGSYVCATCKPTFFQRLEQGAAVPGTVEYGGFWLRGAAKLLDQMIISAITTPFSMAVTFFMGIGMASVGGADEGNPAAMVGFVAFMYIVLILLSIAIPLAYHTWMVGKYGATLGKMACRLRVVRSDMSALTYKRACGRYFAEMVTGFTFGIGYLIAAFDDEKKTLHDIIADTRIIKRS